MGTLVNMKKPPSETFGQKVKNVAETIGALKGVYDIGKSVYSGLQTAAPFIEAAVGLL
jgi:hypothetical protein